MRDITNAAVYAKVFAVPYRILHSVSSVHGRMYSVESILLKLNCTQIRDQARHLSQTSNSLCKKGQ
jgi:hypothetical protein